ncbi:MAG: hypothetical protein K2Q33_01350, partial [Gammaproteobacteria bacterium]|nr:hypothetical protein [Gammaproteobacteria bacterium]
DFLTFLGLFTIFTIPIWLFSLFLWVLKGFIKDSSVNDIPHLFYSIKTIIVRGWQGEEKLWKVYWLISLPLSIISAYLNRGLLAARDVNSLQMIFYFTFFFLSLIIFLWILRANWRCAYNSDNKIWGHIVRLLCILWLLMFAISVKTEIDSLLHPKSSHYTPTLADIDEIDEEHAQQPQGQAKNVNSIDWEKYRVKENNSESSEQTSSKKDFDWSQFEEVKS